VSSGRLLSAYINPHLTPVGRGPMASDIPDAGIVAAPKVNEDVHIPSICCRCTYYAPGMETSKSGKPTPCAKGAACLCCFGILKTCRAGCFNAGCSYTGMVYDWTACRAPLWPILYDIWSLLAPSLT
jgi:hypothetical protein